MDIWFALTIQREIKNFFINDLLCPTAGSGAGNNFTVWKFNAAKFIFPMYLSGFFGNNHSLS